MKMKKLFVLALVLVSLTSFGQIKTYHFDSMEQSGSDDPRFMVGNMMVPQDISGNYSLKFYHDKISGHFNGVDRDYVIESSDSYMEDGYLVYEYTCMYRNQKHIIVWYERDYDIGILEVDPSSNGWYYEYWFETNSPIEIGKL